VRVGVTGGAVRRANIWLADSEQASMPTTSTARAPKRVPASLRLMVIILASPTLRKVARYTYSEYSIGQAFRKLEVYRYLRYYD
jgi:hypothetical protein